MAARLMLAAFALGLLTLASSLQVRFSAPFWQVRTGDFSAHYFLADQPLGYLGHLDFEQQKFQSAASFYRQSLLGGPSPSVRYGLARCLLKLGQVEEARRQFQLLAREAVGPESQRARSWLQVHRP